MRTLKVTGIICPCRNERTSPTAGLLTCHSAFLSKIFEFSWYWFPLACSFSSVEATDCIKCRGMYNEGKRARNKQNEQVWLCKLTVQTAHHKSRKINYKMQSYTINTDPKCLLFHCINNIHLSSISCRLSAYRLLSHNNPTAVNTLHLTLLQIAQNYLHNVALMGKLFNNHH